MAARHRAALDGGAGAFQHRGETGGVCGRGDRIIRAGEDQHRLAGKLCRRRGAKRHHGAQQDGAGQSVGRSSSMAAAMLAPFE